MKNQFYTTKEQLPMMMNAEQTAMFLGVSRAGTYQLFHREDFPSIRIGKRMMVQREALLSWLEAQQNRVTNE